MRVAAQLRLETLQRNGVPEPSTQRCAGPWRDRFGANLAFVCLLARRTDRAATGESLVFFPEGTFTETRAIGKFHAGAFATAARNQMPVVALALHGTRDALPSGTLFMRRVAMRVEVLAIFEHCGTAEVHVSDIREQARQLIASAVGEPLIPVAGSSHKPDGVPDRVPDGAPDGG